MAVPKGQYDGCENNLIQRREENFQEEEMAGADLVLLLKKIRKLGGDIKDIKGKKRFEDIKKQMIGAHQGVGLIREELSKKSDDWEIEMKRMKERTEMIE